MKLFEYFPFYLFQFHFLHIPGIPYQQQFFKGMTLLTDKVAKDEANGIIKIAMFLKKKFCKH